ncbi:uncharacterized protein EI97DRAFT_406570 [Westerdykella ornata]|uniref:Wings apart-like protein C-terminal domain-containing protein n=1 Tax=Westerdykella ornata TaxID=318751 RepID=A0A6A6J7D3_WESOR|nr:uncharacterized protein EI97DRAFT_406570 [Westerdykella ornata]KAF2272305.1 hypothetical protein EI97DRAFT_406570 [Westerdykella ornata]
MANSISPAFTTAHRRKRNATYGKASRSLIKTTWNDDVPSPERPRRHVDTSASITQTRLDSLKSHSSINGSKATTSPKDDIFNVPSDDELPSRSTPAAARKLSKKPAQADLFDVPESDDDVAQPQHRRTKTPQALHRAETRTLKPDVPPPPNRNNMKLSTSATSSPPLKSTTSQAREKKGYERNHSNAKPSRMAASAAAASNVHPRVVVGNRKRADKSDFLASSKPPSKAAADHDIYDVPSSGDEATIVSPPRRKPAPIGRSQVQIPPSKQPLSPISSLGELSDSGTRKRKRNDEALSHRLERSTDVGRKVRQCSKGPEHGTNSSKTSGPMSKRGENDVLPKQIIDAVWSTNPVNKPKRTRLRTVPDGTRPLLAKAPSSPAKLRGMLAMGFSHEPSMGEYVPVTNGEDEMMYDIPEPSTPPTTRPNHLAAGSLTPRQKNILSALVSDADATSTGMPSIRRLQLSERRPGLPRSASDIPQSACTRRTRLIDSLKQAASVSDEDTESDRESERASEHAPAPASPQEANVESNQFEVDQHIDPLDVDVDAIVPGHSQPSQNTESRVTYARQRSYRQEANPEDDLLLAMDMDDFLGYNEDGRNRGQESSSEDEGDPASQMRGLHALRREGEDQRFRMEAQTAVDDIADKAGLGKSVRRSAMLDFCSRMADKTFLGQLLESALLEQFLGGVGYAGEVIFDFAAIVAVGFVLEAGPNVAILEETWKCGILKTLEHHLDLDTDINRIARERKTNLSMIGRESVRNFRTMVQRSTLWSSGTPEKVTPQVVALRTLELLVLGLRKAGNTQALVSEEVVHKLLHVAAASSKGTAQDLLSQNMAFSIMEGLSISGNNHTAWTNGVLERLADATATLYEAGDESPVKLATRLCILLTNNKPKACEVFARESFIASLVGFIIRLFQRLADAAADEELEARENLILCLGAMINIAEFSNQARLNVVANGDGSIDALVNTFLEGSERAARADSVEESQANIPIGYLTVLLGNLCLSDVVRRKIRSRLPGQRLDVLIEKVKEFVSFHERVDRMTDRFEGDEGRQVSQTYTKRLMQVVRRLELADS